MQFLNPLWLFALAALAVPVIIHLWNVRPGKTLKVGSIALITEASKSTRRSFKLLDILLLLLRCLLLALLALLLASPVWQSEPPVKKETGWLLIPKENLRETYKKFKPAIDSLNKAGYGLHYFNSGFSAADLAKALADTTLKDSGTNANYWSVVKALDERLPTATPAYVFTPNGIAHYKGERPQVSLNLHWQTYTAADSVRKWISSATMAGNGAITVNMANSTPAGVDYTRQVLQAGGNNEIGVNINNGRPFVTLKGSTEAAVAADTATKRLAIYTDKHQVDAAYLKAALYAAVAFTGHKAIVRQYADAAQVPAGQNWVFWLSEQPLSGAAKSAENIFTYQPGKAAVVNSWINPGCIPLTRRIPAKKVAEIVWQDGWGNPVLDVDGNTYRFYSRFNPLWNDMVWNDGFPKMILKLVYQSQPPRYDKRILSNARVQPDIKKVNKTAPEVKTMVQHDLSRYFWLLLAAVFIAERFLSHKTKQASNA